MGGERRFHNLRRTLGVALPLLVLALAPTPARASCGDYVLIGHHDQLSPLPAERPLPCHGPGCSQLPEAPPLLPVAPVSAAGDEWACPAAQLAPPTADRHPRPEADAPAHPVRAPSDIFHPPRPVTA